MAFYRVCVEYPDGYVQIREYFKSLENAYTWCAMIAEKEGNNVETWEKFLYEIEHRGRSYVAEFTITTETFEDENG